MRAPGVSVPSSEAEATRRRLAAEGLLRNDLKVLRDGDAVVFPTTEGPHMFDFEERIQRPNRYQDLLPWTEAERALAPRAYDPLGDIVVVKVPEALADKAGAIGAALLEFQQARAVFHDKGVTGALRTRDLERIAGTGGSETTISENGVRLTVDPAKAYFSPRLGDERARMVRMLEPGQSLIDLFGGVAPLGVQAARVAEVTSVDLNPEACRLATLNAAANDVLLRVVCGDARVVAPTLESADHVVMNLPHGAWDFLDVAWPLVAPGGHLHFHAIIRDDDAGASQERLLASAAAAGREAHVVHRRHVRGYATGASHYVWDVRA